MRSFPRLAALLFLGGSLAISAAAPAAGTGLSEAASAGDLEQVKARLAAGEDVNGFDKWGWTPLMWAVYDRHLALTEFLLERGADPNLQAQRSRRALAKGATPLIIASSAARFWGGVLAGRSYVHASVRLVDAASGKVEREQLLRTENSAWGATYTMGSTDSSLPMDMGRIIAGYVLTVAGRQ